MLQAQMKRLNLFERELRHESYGRLTKRVGDADTTTGVGRIAAEVELEPVAFEL